MRGAGEQPRKAYQDYVASLPEDQRPERPKGGAWFIEPTKTIGEQIDELDKHRQEGRLLVDTKTKPRERGSGTTGGRIIEWGTNTFVLVEAKSFLCYQAAIIAALSATLTEIGVQAIPIPEDPKHPDQGASFAQLNQQLATSEGVGQAFTLGKVLRRMETVLDVFAQSFGTYVIHCFHFNDEDIDFPQEAESIPHYICYNAATRLLQLYPEVRAFSSHIPLSTLLSSFIHYSLHRPWCSMARRSRTQNAFSRC